MNIYFLLISDKNLVEGIDVEGAEDIRRNINLKNAEMTGKRVKDDEPAIPERPETAQKPEQSPGSEPKEKDPDRVIYVEFKTLVGKKRKRKKVDRLAVTEAELAKMMAENENASVQLSLFG